jgi:hypothetical protein
MILPSKHLSQNRALVGVGADILSQLQEPITVSELWERVRDTRKMRADESPLPFDWFVLALTFLHAIYVVDIAGGTIFVSRERT